MPAKRKFDVDLAFVLFCAGFSQMELAQKFSVVPSAMHQWCKKWEPAKRKFLAERVEAITKNVEAEQKQFRALERDRARKLLGLADEAIRSFKIVPTEVCVDDKGKQYIIGTKVEDIARLVELGHQCGRAALGMPLDAVEVEVKHTLPDNLQRALDKMYPQPKQVEEAKAIEVETVKPNSEQ